MYKNLLLLIVIMLYNIHCIAADTDSGLIIVQNYIEQKIKDKIQENEERAAQGLPKDYIVFADVREAQYNADNNHTIILRQQNTPEQTLNSLWDFNNNSYLNQIGKKLQDFANETGYDYYLVIAAIYNIDDDAESTDFTKVAWSELDKLKHPSEDPLDPSLVSNGQDKFSRLWGHLTNKIDRNKNALYHYAITVFFPVSGEGDALVGKTATIQAVFFNNISTSEKYNNLFANTFGGIQGKGSSKEERLLNSIIDLQDYAQQIHNFNEDEITHIDNQADMIKYLKELSKKTDIVNIMQTIYFKTREKIIEVLNKGDLVDGYLIPLFDNEGGENAMLLAIRTTPKEQADSLKDLLSSNNYSLLKDLNNKFDDAGFWGTGNNYTEFVKALTNVFNSSLKDGDIDKMVSENRIYKLSNSNGKELENIINTNMDEVTSGIKNATGYFRTYYKIDITDITAYKLTAYTQTLPDYTKIDIQSGTFAVDNTHVSTDVNNRITLPVRDNNKPDITLSPFDLIMVIPKYDMSVNNFTLSKEQFVVIPMYYYYWLAKKHSNEQIEDVLKITGNVVLVASMATGVGALVEAGNFARGAYIATTLLIDAKLLVDINTKGSLDKWMKDNLLSEVYYSYKALEYCYLIYMGTRGAVILTKGATAVVTKYAEALYTAFTKDAGLLAKLKTQYSDFYAQLKTFFNKVLGKDLEAGEILTIDKDLLQEVNDFASTNPNNAAIESFVNTNINRITKSLNTIWAMTSDVIRGRIWEQVRALTDLKDWQFIGGQNQKLLDFFYNDAGIIMQQKSIRASVTESTLNSYKSTFGTIIDNIEDVVKNGTYKLQDGSVITVSKGQFEVVVQKGLNYNSLQTAIENRSPFVTVKFIEK